MQGALASVSSLVTFGAPVIFGNTFDWTYPDAPRMGPSVSLSACPSLP